MRPCGYVLAFLLVPVVALLTLGCGSGYREQFGPGDEGGFVGAGSGGEQKLAKVDSTGWATLKGRITYDGELPKGDRLNITKDQGVCECKAAVKRGDNLDQTWQGKKSGGKWGVRNVVVFLKAPKGKYFETHEYYKDLTEDHPLGVVELDQPFCAYAPHVRVLFPSYYDGKEDIKSGQKFVVLNSAPIAHNAKTSGNNPLYNSDYDSGTIAPGGKVEVRLNPQETPIKVECSIHPWMRAYAWVFNHPYATATDENGEFEIKYVPAGAEVTVCVWHEGIGFLEGQDFAGQDGKVMTLPEDELEELNLTIKE